MNTQASCEHSDVGKEEFGLAIAANSTHKFFVNGIEKYESLFCEEMMGAMSPEILTMVLKDKVKRLPNYVGKTTNPGFKEDAIAKIENLMVIQNIVDILKEKYETSLGLDETTTLISKQK